MGIDDGEPGVVVDENGKVYEFFHKPTGDTLMERAKVRKECTSVDEQYQVSQLNSWGLYVTDEFSPTVCYFDELQKLGADEYVQYFADYYEALNR